MTAKQTRKLTPKPTKVTIEAIGRVSNASVLKCTGRSWDFWVKQLDRAGARGWTHKEIVAFLKKKYRLSLWWQQGVATGYEQHLGKKTQGRNEKGLYQVTATKSLTTPQREVWKALTSSEGMAVWLKPFAPLTWKPGAVFEIEGGIFGEIRTLKAPLRARLKWQDERWEKPTYLQILVVARPAGKSILCFMHDGLKDATLRDRMREHWKKALEEFKQFLAARV